MPKEVTITLDSGCFLPKKGTHCEIGYFQCEPSVSDISITADGYPVSDRRLDKLGDGSCVVQIHHKDADGGTKADGISITAPFHDKLLHMHDLYNHHVAVDRQNFDCILLFESGEFSAADVRERKFKRLKKLPGGDLHPTPEEGKKVKEIAHDIRVHFTLADNESIVLTRNGSEFWSISKFNELNIRINADDSTTQKFYRYCFEVPKDSYWLPNPDDPPPVCPLPPCQDGGP